MHDQDVLTVEPGSGRRLFGPWWTVAIPFCVALAVWWKNQDDLRRIIRRGVPPHGNGIRYMLISLLVVVVASMIGGMGRVQKQEWDRATSADIGFRLLRLGFWIAVLANIAQFFWLGLATRRAGGFSILVDKWKSNTPVFELKGEFFQTVAGLTTSTQFAQAAAVLAIVGFGLMRLSGVNVNGRAKRVLITAVILAVLPGAFRALLLSERLAAYEVIAPAVVAAVFVGLRLRQRARRGVAVGAFILLLALVAAVWFTSEGTRSGRVRKNQNSSLGEVGTTRFERYLSTAINNGAWTVEVSDRAKTPFLNTFRSLWTFPVLRTYIPYRLIEPEGARGATLFFRRFETGFYNPEFNTMSGPGYLYLDWGWWALLPISIVGLISGRLYRRARAGDLFGMLVYPGWCVGLLEFWRILYWSSGRYLPSLVLVVVVALVYMPAVRFARSARAIRATRIPVLANDAK